MSAWLHRFWIQLTADKRRFSMLCATVAVGLLLWARLIVVSNMPRTAVAGSASTAVTGHPRGGSPTPQAPSDTRPAHLVRVPVRDPFVISPVHFPKLTSEVSTLKEPNKSGLQSADESSAAVVRTAQQQLMTALASLRLEGVMTGPMMALVNGKVYRVGDRIVAPVGSQMTFDLIEVKERSVVLAYGERRFELKIETPGGE